MSDGFETPHEVPDVQVVFAANVSPLMPAWETIPESFRKWDGDSDSRPWIAFQNAWMFKGLPKDTVFHTREGIDRKAALRHLAVTQQSFEPKWEHKQAAVAWLASRWFESIEIPGGAS